MTKYGFLWITAAILVAVIGATAGYYVGDWAIRNSTLVTPKEYTNYRVGLPLAWAMIGEFFLLKIYMHFN